MAKYLRHTTTLEQSRRTAEKQLAEREANFLITMERAVYAYPSNPYRRMLQHAGYELEDLRRLVGEVGLEATLDQLYDAGVYVTQDELKGRQPIRRDGLEIAVKQTDFDNPLIGRADWESKSSGSTGEPNRVRGNFESRESRVMTHLVQEAVSRGRPMAYWTYSGLHRAITTAKRGVAYEKCYRTTPYGFNGETYRIVSAFVVGNLMGRKIPWPHYVPRDQAVKIARWLAEKTAAGTPAVMSSHASPAIRICLAARNAGLDISGTLFRVGGEPFTSGKEAVVKSVGATASVGYTTIELGSPVASGCGTPASVDDMHLITDRLAMIHRPRQLATGETMSAMIFTSLMPKASKLLLNWESADCAIIEERQCGCMLGDMGFTTHISDVQSYEKLTSEGVTFSASLLYHLVEEVLPARFGGQLGDYQLVEEEEDGLPRVRIVVSPRVGPVDEAAVIAVVMENLESSHEGAGGKEMTDQWRQGETLQVVRREPEVTRTQKVAPLRVRSRDGAREERVPAGADD
ncbi:MAG TPA: hypothetical protein VI759_06300 [Dehalococcoidia bacterium]|nr:hypothetical protein [Dehalococcoidia bacterium]